MRQLARFLFTAAFLFPVTPSVADEVTIEWQKVPGASRYELRILKDKSVVLQKGFPSKDAKWKGSLPFGLYSYELRILDKKNRASPWSEPTKFFVTPSPPQLIVPPNGSTVLFRAQEGVTFRWTQVGGVARYLLEVQGDQGARVREFVDGSEAVLTQLTPGLYKWKVKPVLSVAAGKSVQSQVLEVKSSEQWIVRVDVVDKELQLAKGAERLWLRPHGPSKFLTGDFLCLFSSDRKRPGLVGCGSALGLTPSGNVELALIPLSGERLSFGSDYLVTKRKQGDRSSRLPASEPRPGALHQALSEPKPYRFNVGAGMMAGTTYVVPSFGVRSALGVATRAGLDFSYASDSDAGLSLSLLGTHLTFSYAFEQRAYAGFYGELGLGAYWFREDDGAGNRRSRVSPSGFLTAGWRARFRESGWNAGVALGVMYVAPANLVFTSTTLTDWLPLFRLTVGYAF
jgi:hypothetical protein